MLALSFNGKGVAATICTLLLHFVIPTPLSPPPHAGKTTLLDVLAFRKTTGTVGGLVTLNGVPATSDSMGRAAGYCEQEDVHLPTTTVRRQG